jgi:hypothetical protein
MWESVRSTITHPLVAGPLGGGVVVLLAYLDAKFRDIKREKSTYWKLFMVSGLVIATLVYLVSEEFLKTDEFLNQEYETELAGSMMPRSRGGYDVSNPYQPELKGPRDNITEMMNNLQPSEVEIVSPIGSPSMPKSVFVEHRGKPGVSMKISRVKSHGSKRGQRGKRSHGRSKVTRSTRSRRSGRSGRSRKH